MREARSKLSRLPNCSNLEHIGI